MNVTLQWHFKTYFYLCKHEYTQTPNRYIVIFFFTRSFHTLALTIVYYHLICEPQVPPPRLVPPPLHQKLCNTIFLVYNTIYSRPTTCLFRELPIATTASSSQWNRVRRAPCIHQDAFVMDSVEYPMRRPPEAVGWRRRRDGRVVDDATPGRGAHVPQGAADEAWIDYHDDNVPEKAPGGEEGAWLFVSMEFAVGLDGHHGGSVLAWLLDDRVTVCFCFGRFCLCPRFSKCLGVWGKSIQHIFTFRTR